MKKKKQPSKKIAKERAELIKLTNKHPEAILELAFLGYITSGSQCLDLSPTFYAVIDARILRKYNKTGRADLKTVRAAVAEVVKACTLTKPAKTLLKKVTLPSQERILAQFFKKHRAVVKWIVKDRQSKKVAKKRRERKRNYIT